MCNDMEWADKSGVMMICVFCNPDSSNLVNMIDSSYCDWLMMEETLTVDNIEEV